MHPLRAGEISVRRLKARRALWLLLGVALLGVHCNPGVEEELVVPLRLVNLPAELAIANYPPGQIEIRVRGSRKSIAKLADQRPRYRLDLSRAHLGRQSFTVDPGKLPLPDGLKIVRTFPERLNLWIELKIQKQVPVSPQLEGAPLEDFQVVKATVEPPHLMLQGPESLVRQLETVPTQPIELTGRSAGFRKEIALDLDPNITIIEGPALIKAAVFIEQKVALRTYADLPIQGENTAYQWSISPATIALTLKGPVRMLEKLENDHAINVSVDLKDLTPGLYVRRAKIALPLGIQLVKADPELFSVKIQSP